MGESSRASMMDEQSLHMPWQTQAALETKLKENK